MKKIADISHYQGTIDWSKAREELDLVIFRASVGSNADKKYLEYTRECGIPYGAYHYVKAGTAAEAEAEARFFVECANKAAVRPLFYIADIEYEAQTKTTTEAVCVAFLRTLREFGCGRIGMYINTRYPWAGAAIDMCDIMWIPRWGKNDGSVPGSEYKPKYPCDIWQYTSKGRVEGISGNVDLDMLLGEKSLDWYTEQNQNNSTEQTEENGGTTNMLTNLMLAAYCELVYAAKWVYWYGTCGYACSTSLYTRKKAQYPSHYTSGRESGYKADIANGRMCADCVGLIKSFFWKGGDINGANKYASNNCPDKSADGLFAMCTEKGPIKSIPEIPGLAVHRPGHIGVYIGGGYTIEMKGFAYDCVKAKVTDGTWTEWGKLPASMLAYIDGDVTLPSGYSLGDRVLSKGCTGSDVSELQSALVSLGYDCGNYGSNGDGVDGDFGSKTQDAVKQLQIKAGLEQTGVLDEITYKALLAALAPAKEDDRITDTPEGGSAPAYILIIEGDEQRLRLLQSAHGGTLATIDSVKVVDA